MNPSLPEAPKEAVGNKLWKNETAHSFYRHMGRVKRKSAFEHTQNAQIQIILSMHKVSSGPLLSIYTFCSIQWFC